MSMYKSLILSLMETVDRQNVIIQTLWRVSRRLLTLYEAEHNDSEAEYQHNISKEVAEFEKAEKMMMDEKIIREAHDGYNH